VKVTEKCFTILGLISVTALILPVARAADAAAWLEFCDTCSGTYSFENAAIGIPSLDSTVFVLNRESGEVRKFGREVDREDGFMIWVYEIPMTQQEQDAFAADFEKASVSTVPIDRDALGDFQSGIFQVPPADSVIDDLQEGRLNSLVQAKFTDFIDFNNFLPSTAALGTSLGVDLRGAGFNIGEDRAYYPRDKAFLIEYPDGSQLMLVVNPSLDFVRVFAFDADGQEIRFTVDDDGSTGIDSGSFENRELFFEPREPDAVADLIRALGRSGRGGGPPLSCTGELLPNGRWSVSCPRSN